MMKRSLASAAIALSTSALAFAACQSETAPLPDQSAVDALGDEPPLIFCGGFLGLQCSEGYACKDDPRDDCDPHRGGADCNGLCVDDGLACTIPGRKYVATSPAACAAIRFYCQPGLTAFFDECGCGCEPPRRGTTCGGNLCGANEYCCNPSCGICAPKGGACILMVCD
jgi:hypothetical protein